MLAAGCSGRGLTVSTFGPAGIQQVLGPGSSSFVPVEITDRPRPARDAAAILRLRRLLACFRPDVVHAHGMRAGAVAALALTPAPRHSPALLVTVHNAPPAGGAAGPVYQVLERIVARRADAVLAVSPDLVARLQRRDIRDVGLAIVPAPQSAPPSAAEIGTALADIGADGAPVVLAAGRLAEQKGFAGLLDAAAGWQDLDPRPLLVIVGSGPLAGPLAGQARAQRLAARFLGQRDDVPALLAAADVVVVPSHWEGQPLIVQEALRAGTPLVASRVGGIPDLTGEDAALLVPPSDSVRLAAAVLAVLGDQALAARLRAAALARAGALPSEADAVDAAIAAYRRLAARRGQPG